MDAKYALTAIWAGLLAGLTGCYPMHDGPSARPPRPAPVEHRANSEAVKVADSQTEETSDIELEPVRGYLQRIDDLERRKRLSGGRARRGAPAGAASPDARGVGDAQGSPVATNPDPEAPPPERPRDAAQPTPATREASPTQQNPDGVDPAAGPTTQPAAAESPPLDPPVVARVSVLGGPPLAALPPREEPARPRVNRGATAPGAPTTIQELVKQLPPNPETASFRRQLDSRILHVIAGDHGRARAALTMVSAEQQEMAARLVESLIAIREAHDGDPPGAASRVLKEWTGLAEALRPLSELRIPTLAICQEVTGYGQYRPIDPPRFPAGRPSEFVAYCEVRNFVREQQAGGMYETHFEMRTRILDSSGGTVLDIRDTDIVDRCRQPRQDCFVPRLVRLPSTLSPGEYVVKVTIVDKLGQKVAENRATFRVIASP